MKKSDDESDEEIPSIPLEKSNNPWLGGTEPSQPTPEITSGYRKLWNDVNESKKAKKQMVEETTEVVSKPVIVNGFIVTEMKKVGSSTTSVAKQQNGVTESPEMQEEFSEELDEGLMRKTTMDDFGMSSAKDETGWDHRSANQKRKFDEPNNSNKDARKKMITDIDPNKFVSMQETTILKSSVPVTEEGNEESDDDEDQRRMTLAEAFADDDVIDQFKEEKKQIVNASTPKDIDLTLPGWGEWGGSGLKISKQKKKRFIIKAPPAPARRDDNKGSLIINEDKNVLMRRQQVSIFFLVLLIIVILLYIYFFRFVMYLSHSARRLPSNLQFELLLLQHLYLKRLLVNYQLLRLSLRSAL